MVLIGVDSYRYLPEVKSIFETKLMYEFTTRLFFDYSDSISDAYVLWLFKNNYCVF